MLSISTRASGRCCENLPRGLEPIHAGQGAIHDHDLRMEFVGELDRFLAVARPRRRQQCPARLPECAGNPRRTRAWSSTSKTEILSGIVNSSFSRGTVSRTRVPPAFGRAQKSTVPPSNSRAFAHRHQANSALWRLAYETLAVIFHFEFQSLRQESQTHPACLAPECRVTLFKASCTRDTRGWPRCRRQEKTRPISHSDM